MRGSLEDLKTRGSNGKPQACEIANSRMEGKRLRVNQNKLIVTINVVDSVHMLMLNKGHNTYGSV